MKYSFKIALFVLFSFVCNISVCYSQSDINANVSSKELDLKEVHELLYTSGDKIIVNSDDKTFVYDNDFNLISEHLFSESAIYATRTNLNIGRMGRPSPRDYLNLNDRIFLLYQHNVGEKKKEIRTYLTHSELFTEDLIYSTEINEDLMERLNQEPISGYGIYALIEFERKGKTCLAIVCRENDVYTNSIKSTIDKLNNPLKYDSIEYSVRLFDHNLESIDYYTNTISKGGGEVRILNIFVSESGQLFLYVVNGKNRKIYMSDGKTPAYVELNYNDKVLEKLCFFEQDGVVNGLSFYVDNDSRGLVIFEFDFENNSVSRKNISVDSVHLPNGKTRMNNDFMRRLHLMGSYKQEPLQNGEFLFISEQAKNWVVVKSDGGRSSRALNDSMFICKFNSELELVWSSIVPKHQGSANNGSNFMSYYHFIQDGELNILFNSIGNNYNADGTYKEDAIHEPAAANKMDYLILAKINLENGEVISQSAILDYEPYKRYITIAEQSISFNHENNMIHAVARGMNAAATKIMGYKIDLN